MVQSPYINAGSLYCETVLESNEPPNIEMSFWEDDSPKLYPLKSVKPPCCHHMFPLYFVILYIILNYIILNKFIFYIIFTLQYITIHYITLHYTSIFPITTGWYYNNLTTNTNDLFGNFIPEPSSAEAKAKRSAQRAPNLQLWLVNQPPLLNTYFCGGYARGGLVE